MFRSTPPEGDLGLRCLQSIVQFHDVLGQVHVQDVHIASAPESRLQFVGLQLDRPGTQVLVGHLLFDLDAVDERPHVPVAKAVTKAQELPDIEFFPQEDGDVLDDVAWVRKSM